MTKTEFLKKTVPYFIQRGYRSLSIDEIVSEFNISKNTMYKLYRNKKELIEDALEYELKVFEEIAIVAQNEENFFDYIDMILDKIFNFQPIYTQNNNFQELKKYYPFLYEKHYFRSKKLLRKIINSIIERGRNEGLVQEDISAKSLGMVFAKTYMNLITHEYDEKETSKEIVDGFIQLFIKGILNKNGFEQYYLRNT